MMLRSCKSMCSCLPTYRSTYRPTYLPFYLSTYLYHLPTYLYLSSKVLGSSRRIDAEELFWSVDG